MRCLERMLRRADFPMAMSQGFNPRPKMTFALALGLGIEGLREVVDLELSEPSDLSVIVERLRSVAPPGFDWKDAEALPPNAPAPHPRTVEYSFPVVAERRESARCRLQSLLACSTWPMTRHRPDRDVNFDLRTQLVEAELTTEGLLRFRLKVSPEGSARPEELLEAIALRDLLDGGAFLTRTNIDLESMT
jgi:radical SAM-linked protein